MAGSLHGTAVKAGQQYSQKRDGSEHVCTSIRTLLQSTI